MPDLNTLMLMLPQIGAQAVAQFFHNRGESDYLREFFSYFGGYQFVEGECPDDGDTIATEDGNVCLICGKVITQKFVGYFTFTVEVEAANEDDAEEKAVDEARGLLGGLYYDLDISLDRVEEGSGW